MTAIETPAADAPASEWGALAFSIPGWPTKYEQPREQLVDDDGIEWIYSDQSDWFNGGSGHPVPNPDHDGTAGCLLALLGDTLAHISTGFGDGYVVCIIVYGDTIEGTGRTLGRACIATAAALGRWPGREG